MIIDAHTHLGHGGLIKASPKDLIASMKRSKIDKAVIFAGDINDFPIEDAVSMGERYKKHFAVVGSFSVGAAAKSDFKFAEECLRKNLMRGLKFYLGYEHLYPTDPILRPWLELLEKYNYPAIFHTGMTYSRALKAKLKFTHPLLIDEVAVEHPNLKIIIAHLGDPWLFDAAAVISKNENVFADISGWSMGERFTKMEVSFYKRNLLEIRAWMGGSLEKLIFGTDWPLCDQADYLKLVASLHLSFSEKEKILYKNAKEIFRLAE